jgi:hypothetical protein
MRALRRDGEKLSTLARQDHFFAADLTLNHSAVGTSSTATPLAKSLAMTVSISVSWGHSPPRYVNRPTPAHRSINAFTRSESLTDAQGFLGERTP